MEALTHGLALLQNGWAAFSGLATLTGLGGVLAIATALLLGAWLPGFVRTPLIVAGAIALGIAGGLQAGQMRGAAEQLELNHRRALAAEEARTAAARRVTEALAVQATRDIAAAQADLAKLQELNDALRHDPRRDGVCLDRDLSRRLREL